jgi:ribosome-binding factor A
MQKELRDPRAASANVNDVVMTRDLSIAKVYVTFLDPKPEDSSEAVEVLNKAAGYLRSQLASRNTMRSTPKLKFYYDQTVPTAERMSKLIDEAMASQKNDSVDSAS